MGKSFNRQYLIWLLVSLLTGRVDAAYHAQTNLLFFDQLLTTACDELMQQCDDLPLELSIRLKRAITTQSMITDYAQNQFVDFIEKRGYSIQPVALNNSDSLNTLLRNHPIIYFDIQEGAVWYDRWIEQPVFGKGSLERRGKIKVTLSVVSQKGDLLGYYSADAAAADTIQEGDISRLERGDQVLGTLDLPKKRNIKKLIEPVLAIGASSAIVFLFYYIRSKN